jgi:hypothetical protein
MSLFFPERNHLKFISDTNSFTIHRKNKPLPAPFQIQIGQGLTRKYNTAKEQREGEYQSNNKNSYHRTLSPDSSHAQTANQWQIYRLNKGRLPPSPHEQAETEQ